MSVIKYRQRKLRKILEESEESIINRRVIFFLIENLLPFDTVNGSSFRELFPSKVKLPEAETLVYLANELYNDYRAYFQEYYKKQELIALTCHSCELTDSYDPYMLISAHFIDRKYRLCEVPVGMMTHNQSNWSSLVVRDIVMNEFKNKVSSITTNHSFDDKCREMFLFLMDDDTTRKVLIFPCIPAFLNSLVKQLFEDMMVGFGFAHKFEYNLSQTYSTLDTIPEMVEAFLGPVFKKFCCLDVKQVKVLEEDEGGVYFGILCEFQESNEKSQTLRYLNSCLVYKKQFESLVSEFEWLVIEFVVELNRIIYGIVLHSDSNLHPAIHLVLKWIKVLIVKLEGFSQDLSSLIESQVQGPLQKLIVLVRQFHGTLENWFQISLASYLHPGTRRFLKESHINNIVATVNRMSIPKQELGDLDSKIFQTFECMGNATECYHYERIAEDEIGYSNKTYLAKEYGADLLTFWKLRQKIFPVLGQLSRQTLASQVCSDRDYDYFKRRLPQLTGTGCLLNVLFYLHTLMKRYDLREFDEKNMKLDIESYRRN